MPMKSLNRGLLVRGRVSKVVERMTGGRLWDWPHAEYRNVTAAMKQVLRKGSRTGFLIYVVSEVR